MDYEYWSSISEDQLASLGVAEMNLMVAAGLPGTESLDVGSILSRMDRWTEIVYSNTRYWLPKFVPQDDCRPQGHSFFSKKAVAPVTSPLRSSCCRIDFERIPNDHPLFAWAD